MIVAPKGGRSTPSSRYRLYDLAPGLERAGWRVAFLTPSAHRQARARALVRDFALASRAWDVLLIQRPGRRREESVLLRLAASRARVVALDVDDPVAESGTFAWAIRRADIVFAGSRRLVELYTGRVPRVVHLPTALDTESYRQRAGLARSGIIGWIGDGPAYAASLERMIRALAAAGGGREWRLRIIGTKGDAALEDRLADAAGTMGLELVPEIDWEDEAEVATEVGSFDLGLAPVRDAEGASFKTTQYLAAGVLPLVEAGGEGERIAREALGSDASVVPPMNAEALGRELHRLSDLTLRRELAARAQTAAAAFSRDSAATRLDEQLRRLLEERE